MRAPILLIERDRIIPAGHTEPVHDTEMMIAAGKLISAAVQTSQFIDLERFEAQLLDRLCTKMPNDARLKWLSIARIVKAARAFTDAVHGARI